MSAHASEAKPEPGTEVSETGAPKVVAEVNTEVKPEAGAEGTLGAPKPGTEVKPEAGAEAKAVPEAVPGETLGGAAAVAFNTYWAALMSNWTSVYNAAGTISLSTNVCHASCHASCHGSRGRR